MCGQTIKNAGRGFIPTVGAPVAFRKASLLCYQVDLFRKERKKKPKAQPTPTWLPQTRHYLVVWDQMSS